MTRQIQEEQTRSNVLFIKPFNVAVRLKQYPQTSLFMYLK